MKPLTFPIALALAIALAVTGPAGAAGPTPGCFGVAAKDKAGDQASAAPAPGPGARENLDILEGFFTSDAKEAAVNFHMANLTKELPAGATAISWYLRFGTTDGERWTRAMTDFTGVVAYDYGQFQTVGIQEFSVRDGETTGELFEGKDGVVKIVLAPDAAGKAGTQIKSGIFYAYEARQVLPAASPTPIKGGFLYEVDDATSKGTFTVGQPCPAAPPADTGVANTLKPAPPPTLNVDAGALPVKLLTTKVRAKSARKRLTLKVRSTEALTKVGVQVRKGKKVVAKGTLAKLVGNGTFKLKARKLAKGAYTVDFVGSDGQGRRRFSVARLTIR